MRQASELRSYQQSVATYLYENDSALAVVKMGGGKTASTLTAIVDLLRDGHIRHALVMAPKRVARVTWPDEIAEWAHTQGLRYAVLKGTPAQREALLRTAHERDLTIVGIDVAQWLAERLLKLPADHPLFDLLVIDEISKLRSTKGKRTKAMRSVGPRFNIKWGLTGTPRPKSLLNLFAPMRLLTSGKLWGNNFDTWKRKHFYPVDFNGYDWKPLPGAEAQLMADAARYSLTLAEGDMPELPPLNIIPEFVELPDPVRKEYRRMARELFARTDAKNILAATQAAAKGKLAQIANGFLYADDGNADVTKLHDEKRDWIAELVEELDGEPLLVVYEFVEDLRMLRDLFGADLPYLGDGVSDKNATRWIEAWNRRELPLFAMHPASGGHGLNIQFGGSREAWISPCWDAELWEQTLFRLYRPGQTAESVSVHVCMARDTVDEMKFARVYHRLSEQAAYERYLRDVGKVA